MSWWNAKRDNALISGLQQGELLSVIAADLGKSVCAVSTRASTLRRRYGEAVVPRRAINQHTKDTAITQVVIASESRAVQQRRDRACMCCGREFLSEGAHNRLCSSCRNKSTSPFDV